MLQVSAIENSPKRGGRGHVKEKSVIAALKMLAYVNFRKKV